MLSTLRNFLRTRGNKKDIRGHNNQIIRKNAVVKHCHFELKGDNNKITIGENAHINGAKFIIHGSNHQISIGARCYLGVDSTVACEDHDCVVSIGEGTTIGQALIGITEPFSRVVIGSDCMISHDVEIRTGDSHAIYDVTSGKRINHAKNVEIANHVWVGAHAKILKGVSVGHDSVIGLGAIVTSSIPANVVAAGNPASIRKKNITWGKARVDQNPAHFTRENIS